MKLTMKKRYIIFLSILFVWAFIAIIPGQNNVGGENPFLKSENGRPLLIAHGGGNQEFPDNTLEAYYNAFSIDNNVKLETDVALTRDGVVILTHDTTLDRRTSLIEAPVHETDYSFLIEEEIDFSYYNTIVPNSNGFNVSGVHTRYTNYLGNEVTPLDVDYPEGVTARHDSVFLATTLEELIMAFPTNTINVEIKQAGELGMQALDAVIEILDRLDEGYNTYERIVLATFHEDMYDAYVNLKNTTHPQLHYSPQNAGVLKFYIFHVTRLSLFYRDSISVLQLPLEHSGITLSTESLIRTANRHNIGVHYWTINDEQTMRELIEMGADGIMTDRPTLLKSVIDEYFD